MHRYVDLHYQYLTSSYACMLSCPISLRPFVILEGTGLGPWGAQGQTKGGLCRQHPFGGSDLPQPTLQYICWIQATNSLLSPMLTLYQALIGIKSGLSGWNITSSVECGFNMSSKMKNILFWLWIWSTWKLQCATHPCKYISMFFAGLSPLWTNQHLVFIYSELRFECHCVGTCSFFCHYRKNVWVPKRKVQGSI